MRKEIDFLRIKVLDTDYNEMLAEHFARIAYELRESRPVFWEDASKLKSYLKDMKEKLREAMGTFPEERTDLKAKVVDKLYRNDYMIEKIIFESRPGFIVTGNLYVPQKAEFPAPAILRVHGHFPYAKTQEIVQATCIGLVKRGYVVLSIDKFGYGERKFQGSHLDGAWLPLVGMTLQGVLLWDNMRAIDYLQSRKEVDPERIGVTGASGGGNQTMYLAALDERVKVAVPTVSTEIFEDQVASGRCYCECIPGMLRFADVSDVLASIVPRPLLILSGIRDEIFSILQARKAFLRVKKVYELLGAGDKVAMFESYTVHDYNREMREAMYSWFDKWLMGIEREEPEPRLELELELGYDLYCLKEPPRDAVTINKIFYEEVLRLRRKRPIQDIKRWISLRDELRNAIIEKVFGGFPEKGDLDVRIIDERTYGNVAIERLTFRSELDIIIPSIVLKPSNTERLLRPIICLTSLGAFGKARILSTRMASEYIAKGGLVMALDYRGAGETSYEEVKAARNSIVIDRHILGMRVYDVLRAIDYIMSRKDVSKEGIEIWAEDTASLIALFAAALDSRIASASLERMLATYESDKGFDYPAFIFPPHMLKYADIPEVAALIAPRTLHIKYPLSPTRSRLSKEEAEKIFDFTKRVYRELGKPQAFILET